MANRTEFKGTVTILATSKESAAKIAGILFNAEMDDTKKAYGYSVNEKYLDHDTIVEHISDDLEETDHLDDYGAALMKYGIKIPCTGIGRWAFENNIKDHYGEWLKMQLIEQKKYEEYVYLIDQDYAVFFRGTDRIVNNMTALSGFSLHNMGAAIDDVETYVSKLSV